MNKLILILLAFTLNITILKANDSNEGSEEISFFQTSTNPGTGGEGDGEDGGDPMDNDDYAPIDNYYPLLILSAVGLILYFKKDFKNTITK